MATPVVSSNILPLRSPYRLHGALQLLLAALVGLIAWRAVPGFLANIEMLRQELSAQRPDPAPGLVLSTVVQGVGFALAAWLVVRHALGGLHRLLAFFIPVGVPGELGQAVETCRQLFVQRVFGHFDRRTSLADKVLVRLVPRLMYLTAPGMRLLRATSAWPGLLLWCGLAFLLTAALRPVADWPWGILVVALGAKVVYAGALFLLTPPQPALHVAEDRQHFENTGNPVNFFNHVEKIAIELRHQTFPNRVIARAEPDITNVQPDVTSTFHGVHLFETQPLPVPRAGSLPAFVLGVAGVAAGAAAVAMLLFAPLTPDATTLPAGFTPWVLTALTVFGFSRNFFARALDLLQVFRFESHLFCVELKGSFTSSNIGIGDGRGGQFFAERRSIQSDTHVTTFGAKIITEASGPNALRAPRVIVDTKSDESFAAALAQLLGGMPTFKDSTTVLPGIAFERPEVKQMLQANLAVTEGMARATAQAQALPGGGVRPPALPVGADDGSDDASAEPAAAVANGAEMKTCPECGEQVRAIARKCRFCNHRFDGVPASPAEATSDNTSPSDRPETSAADPQ